MGDVVGLTPQEVPGNRTADGLAAESGPSVLGRPRRFSPYRRVPRSERQSTHLRHVAVLQALAEGWQGQLNINTQSGVSAGTVPSGGNLSSVAPPLHERREE